MTSLQDVATSLQDVVAPLPSLAESLLQRASRLRVLGGELEDLARRVPGGVNARRQVEALHAAAELTESSARSLLVAAQDGRIWIARTVHVGASSRHRQLESAAVPDGTGGHPLSDGDKSALADYTGTGFVEINPALRDGKVPEPNLAARADAISSALHNLPNHPGPSYRRTTLTSEQLARYVSGRLLVEPGFTSTAADPARVFGGNTVFLVAGIRGKDVSSYSQWDESEVLFDKGTRFVVIGHDVDADGVHFIQMAEI